MNSGEKLKSENRPSRESDWDSLTFEGEKNINSATGERRTFTETDNYPQLDGETQDEYEKRLNSMHEKLAEIEAAETTKNAILDESGNRTDAYLNSEFGQQELAAEAEFDRITNKIDQGIKNQEHANSLKEQQYQKFAEKVDAIRQAYEKNRDGEKQDGVGNIIASDEDVAELQKWREGQDKLAAEMAAKTEPEPTPDVEPKSEPAPDVEPKSEPTPDVESKPELAPAPAETAPKPNSAPEPAQSTEASGNKAPDENTDLAKANLIAAGIIDERGYQTKEYLESEQGKQELAAEALFTKATQLFEELISSGWVKREDISDLQDMLFDTLEKKIDDARLAYINSDKKPSVEPDQAPNTTDAAPTDTTEASGNTQEDMKNSVKNATDEQLDDRIAALKAKQLSMTRPENISQKEIDDFAAEISRLIDKEKDAFGASGAALLTSKEYYDDKKSAEYRQWWDSLSPQGKQAAINIINRVSASRFKNVYPYGNGIRVWLQLGNGKD